MQHVYTNHPSKLAARVHCVNSANQFLHDTVPGILAALRGFIGEKMYTTTGSKTVKFKKILPELPNTPTLRAYFDGSKGHNLWLQVSYSAGIIAESGCVYQDVSYLLGKIDRDVLVEVDDGEELKNRRTDYTMQEVNLARAELRKAQEAVSKANSKLFHFGEFDR